MALNYTTVNKVYAAFPMVGSNTNCTSPVVYAVASAAESIVNGKLAKAYSIPIAGMPPLLETITTDITLYRLLVLRFFTQEQANASVWPDRYKESMDLLDQLVEGTMTLVDSGGAVVPIISSEAGGTVWSNTEGYVPTMDEDDQLQQRVDPNKIDDIRNGRI